MTFLRLKISMKILKPILFQFNHLTLTKFTSFCQLTTMRSLNTGKEFHRLPQTVVPKHYIITLKPDLKNFTFDGNETVNVDVKEKTSQIILNAHELEINSASFKSSNGNVVTSKSIEISKDDETAAINFESPLDTGSGELSLIFTGLLNDKMKGFYRSKYMSPDGAEERYGAVTQFEPTDARRAFPCWDEPSIKAKFDITMIVPKDRVALSNMNVVSELDHSDPNLKEVKFDTTPVMSTYLVACIVGEYDYVEDTSSDGVKVRVYTPLNKKEQGMFALEVATKALPFYKEYFNIAYPLPKMDLIAIADFSSGAMENWGLVTYRETCLLVDPENTSSERKQWIALVVGHELAHQWFGNLVTMEWWTHLWLNEGFASFIEFLCVDHLFGAYDIWTQFVTDVYTRALELDALHNSHPIEVPVGHPSEIDEIFDDISYNKGASVIRMLYRFIGDDGFRKGMHLYLTRHAYKNTFTEDLWKSLEEASNKPIGAVMRTWTKQKGFPVITASARSDGNSRIISLTQEKFCADGKLPPSDANVLWMIPVNISTESDPKSTAVEALMESKSLEIAVPNVGNNQWIKINPGTIGFYRVQYTPEMLDILLPAVKNKTLPPLDRLGLQNDLFAMVQAGRSSTVDILKLMDAFENEDNYTVWNSINTCIGKINLLLSHTDYQPLFHAYGRKLLAKTHARLGWDPVKGESHFDTLLRSLVINRLATFEEKQILDEAKNRFNGHCSGSCVIPADLRSAVYRSVAIDCDDKNFEALFKLYREADLHEEKDRVSRALGAVKDESRIRKVLEFAMSDEVRNQDTVFVIISVAMTKQGRELAWEFFRQKKEELRSRYEGGFLISRLVKYITENFASEDKAQEVETFFAQNPFPGTERTIQQSIETIRLHKDWLLRDESSIRSFVSNRS